MNKDFKESKFINFFKFRGLTSFPFVEQTFDSVNTYQLLSKVVEYLNQVITQQNIVIENMNELIKLYNELKEYVDTYFENLDVQEEINIKLDIMVEDGTLARIINEEIFKEINYNLEDYYNIEKLGAIGDGITDNTLIIQEVLDKYNKIYIPSGNFKASILNLNSDKEIKGSVNSILSCNTLNLINNNKLYGFTFDGNLDSIGIKINGNNNIIENLNVINIKNTVNTLGYGIGIIDGNDNIIKNCYFDNLISGNESAPVGSDDGSIRAIWCYGGEGNIFKNNRFSKLIGYKDGDYIVIQDGNKGTPNENYPYNGSTVSNIRNNFIINNIFSQKECKSCIKIQASNTIIENNIFNLENNTSSMLSVIRIQAGKNNTVNKNTFNSKITSIPFNYFVYSEYNSDSCVSNNIFNIEKCENINNNSLQSVILNQNVKNCIINNNTINVSDIRHIFTISSCENIIINNNCVNGKYVYTASTMLRIVNTFNHINNNITFNNNNMFDEQDVEITQRNSYFDIKDVNNLNIYKNIIETDSRFSITVFRDVSIVKIKENIFKFNNINGSYYPFNFYDNCSVIECLNNFVNYCNAVYRFYSPVIDFTFDNAHNGIVCYDNTSQDFSEYKYITSKYKTQDYDFGFNRKNATFMQGHQFFNFNGNKLQINRDGTFYDIN